MSLPTNKIEILETVRNGKKMYIAGGLKADGGRVDGYYKEVLKPAAIGVQLETTGKSFLMRDGSFVAWDEETCNNKTFTPKMHSVIRQA